MEEPKERRSFGQMWSRTLQHYTSLSSGLRASGLARTRQGEEWKQHMNKCV